MHEKKYSPNYLRTIHYFKQQLKQYKPRVWFIMCTLVFSNILGATAPIYLKKLIDILSKSPNTPFLNSALSVLVFYIVFRFFSFIFVRVAFYFLAILDAEIMASLRQSAFAGLIKHSHSFFVNSFTGSLTQKISKYAKGFEMIWDITMMQVLPLLTWIVTALYMISRFSPQIAGIFLICIICYFVFNFFFIRYKAKYDRMASEAETAMVAGLSDGLSNHNTIVLFTGQEGEEQTIRDLAQKLKNHKIAQWVRQEVMFGTQAVIFITVEYFILRYSITEWSLGLLSAGTVALFQIYIIGLITKLFDFSQVFRRLSESFSDASEMVDILDRPIEITDSRGAKNTVPKNGEIIFKNLEFKYKDGEPLIKDFSLTIPAGQKIAFVGVSGAGKSTLFKLLLRLYDRTQGDLLIDGESISEYTQKALRQSIAFVPQEPILFHRTLKENIRYGRQDATDEEVRMAAKHAECLEFIEKLPHGFDTLVGERGVKLSGGERQRVAIARAILKNAPILLLDEATSSLDSHGEKEIQHALEHLIEGKTVIAIAHRLSTIKKMDRIIVLENGNIIEEGTHDSLLKNKKGLYKKLWDLQVGGFISD